MNAGRITGVLLILCGVVLILRSSPKVQDAELVPDPHRNSHETPAHPAQTTPV